MSYSRVLQMAMWTELRSAILADFPETSVPIEAPPSLREVIRTNANYIEELQSKGETHARSL